jgi:DNA-binding transcriptional LysR family regulator
MTNPMPEPLRDFEASARHRQFGLVVDDCAISQPASLMQIRELQELLDAELVERGARRNG